MNASPGRGNGAVLHGPIPKTAAVREYGACRHSATVEVLLPPGSVRNPAKRCLHCGVFLKWLQKPQRYPPSLTTFKLARLGMYNALSTWQRHSVRDVSQPGKSSPRQQKKLDQLWPTYLGGKTP